MIEPRDFFIAKEHNIKSILRDNNRRFSVPDYQRNFAWTTDELEQLWNDFKKTFENTYNEDFSQKHNVKPHFFGTILLTESEGVFEITDGQQRLTASTVLLKSFLDVSLRLENDTYRTGFASLIDPLIQRSEFGQQFEPRISLDPTIDELYKTYILQSYSSETREDYLRLNPIRIQTPTSSRQRLKEAYDFFISKMQIEYPDDSPQDYIYQKLFCFTETFTRLFTLLEIGVRDKETAYTIFGTINNRGKDLTDSDIIKNEIFKSVQEHRRHLIKEKWDNTIENIDTEDLTDYIRFQFASVRGPVKKVDLFNAITKLISNIDPIGYLEQLRVESEWYSRININGAAFWNEDITKKLQAFKTLEISHSIPLLLTSAVLFNDNEPSFERLVNATLVFCFRYFTLGKNSVENLEREIGNISRSLRNGERTVDQTIDYMESLTTDAEFISDFSLFSTKTNAIAFYILEQLEKSRMTGVVPLPHSPSQHVEHIMPKKPSSSARRLNEWSHVRHNPEYKDFVHRLGNLLILESDINQSVGNKDFIDKKPLYLNSGLSYPSDIAATHRSWDFGTITVRQQRMANEALNIWRYY